MDTASAQCILCKPSIEALCGHDRRNGMNKLASSFLVLAVGDLFSYFLIYECFSFAYHYQNTFSQK